MNSRANQLLSCYGVSKLFILSALLVILFPTKTKENFQPLVSYAAELAVTQFTDKLELGF